jgi:hypothetical protein
MLQVTARKSDTKLPITLAPSGELALAGRTWLTFVAQLTDRPGLYSSDPLSTAHGTSRNALELNGPAPAQRPSAFSNVRGGVQGLGQAPPPRKQSPVGLLPSPCLELQVHRNPVQRPRPSEALAHTRTPISLLIVQSAVSTQFSLVFAQCKSDGPPGPEDLHPSILERDTLTTERRTSGC